jgi:hypothetical protein
MCGSRGTGVGMSALEDRRPLTRVPGDERRSVVTRFGELFEPGDLSMVEVYRAPDSSQDR